MLKGYLKNVAFDLYWIFSIPAGDQAYRTIGLFSGVFDFLAHMGNTAANGIAALAHGFAGVVDVVGSAQSSSKSLSSQTSLNQLSLC